MDIFTPSNPTTGSIFGDAQLLTQGVKSLEEAKAVIHQKIEQAVDGSVKAWYLSVLHYLENNPTYFVFQP